VGKALRPERDPHRGVFFRSWLRDPFRVGAVAPSSRWLAKLMATDVHAGACVVELGAGTGTLTTALVESGVRHEDLVQEHFAVLVARRGEQLVVLRDDGGFSHGEARV